jgi:hypothetical protein
MRNSFWVPLRDFGKLTQICRGYSIGIREIRLRSSLAGLIYGFWCYDDEAYTIFRLLSMKISREES